MYYKLYKYDYGSGKYIKVQHFRYTDSSDVLQKEANLKR